MLLFTLFAFSSAENILIIGRTLAQWDISPQSDSMKDDTIYLLDPQNLNNAPAFLPPFAIQQWEQEGKIERIHRKENTIGIRSTLESFSFLEELPDVLFDKVFFDWSVTKFISNGHFSPEIVKLHARLSPTGTIYVRDYVEMIPEHLLDPQAEDSVQVSFKCPFQPKMLQGTFHLHRDLTMRQVQMMINSDFKVTFPKYSPELNENIKLRNLENTKDIFWMPVTGAMRPLLAYEIPQDLVKSVKRVNKPYPLSNFDEPQRERKKFYFEIPAQRDVNANEKYQNIPNIYIFEEGNRLERNSYRNLLQCCCCCNRRKSE